MARGSCLITFLMFCQDYDKCLRKGSVEADLR